jgi:hypothetical protein
VDFVYAVAALTFSGSYPTGGDTLDFTTVADKMPTTQIVQVFAESQNGNGGYYVPVQGTAMNNWKLKAFAGGGTEHRRRLPRQRHHRRSPAQPDRPQTPVAQTILSARFGRFGLSADYTATQTRLSALQRL